MAKRLIGGPKKRRFREPFHVRQKHVSGKHVGYDILVCNSPFLVSADTRFPLKRHEAYAIVQLLNKQPHLRKQVQKIGEAYV